MFNIIQNNRTYSKAEVFTLVEQGLKETGLTFSTKDEFRPWGGFFVIDEKETEKFISIFFPDEKFEKLQIAGKLSPKILLVAPHKRLSWQYHHRRAEIWKLVSGEAAIIRSLDDTEKPEAPMMLNQKISLAQGERHRLVGSNQWGVVAEIWRHTNVAEPSNEDDIVRLQDDFGR